MGMTLDDIIAKLHRRSESPAGSWNVWLARGYSLADLYKDLQDVRDTERLKDAWHECERSSHG